jgi:hypothetical protein
MGEQMKVSYRTLSGYESKAYLDDEPVAEDTYDGTDKHSDHDVRIKSVKISDDPETWEWVEIEREAMTENLKVVEISLIPADALIAPTAMVADAPKDHYYAIFGCFPNDILLVAGGSDLEWVKETARKWVEENGVFFAMAKGYQMSECNLSITLRLYQTDFEETETGITAIPT